MLFKSSKDSSKLGMVSGYKSVGKSCPVAKTYNLLLFYLLYKAVSKSIDTTDAGSC